MADWQRVLNIKDIWQQASDRNIAANSFCKTLADRLTLLKPFNDYYIDSKKEEILEELEAMSEDSDLTYDDTDYVMDMIYDWGDISLDGKFGGKKVCWVNTF